jgi:hypothetical protein
MTDIRELTVSQLRRSPVRARKVSKRRRSRKVPVKNCAYCGESDCDGICNATTAETLWEDIGYWAEKEKAMTAAYNAEDDVLVSNADSAHWHPVEFVDERDDILESGSSLLFNYRGSERARQVATVVNRSVSGQAYVSYPSHDGRGSPLPLSQGWKAGNPADSEYSHGEPEVIDADEMLRRTFRETDRERQRRLGLDQPPRRQRDEVAAAEEEAYERIEDSDEEAEEDGGEPPLHTISVIGAAVADSRARAYRPDDDSGRRSAERFPAAGSH